MRQLPPTPVSFGHEIAQRLQDSARLRSLFAEFAYTCFMHFILVDTADARGCVALFRDAQLLDVVRHPAEEEFSSWLLPAVRDLLSEASLSHANLDAYAVCAGPGSFTGLRVGLTTVKAWAEIFPRPIVAVSRLEALALWKTPGVSQDTAYRASYLDARRNQVFAALFDRQGASVQPETVMNLGDFLAQVNEICASSPVLWRSPDPELLEQQPALGSPWAFRKSKSDTLETVPPPFAVPLGALAYRKFLAGRTTDAASLDANYVRRSDAELFWKDHASAVKA
jgi:tRNA threonylcarbamoyladenosine biosynthesis protein TsaB